MQPTATHLYSLTSHRQSANSITQSRQDFLHELFSRLEWSAAAPCVLVMHIGPPLDVAEYLDVYTFSRLQIDYLDLAATIKPVAHRIGAAQENSQLVVPPKVFRRLPREHYHLIWAADLGERLNLHIGQHLLPQLLPMLMPGGQAVLGPEPCAIHIAQPMRALSGYPIPTLNNAGYAQ